MNPPDPYNPMFSLPPEFLTAVFQQCPSMIARLRQDGQPLVANAATFRITGYSWEEMAGQNFWALLFPGKLFQQIPRFVSLTDPGPPCQNFPMIIRTRAGAERPVAFSRFYHRQDGQTELICIGTDLSDQALVPELTDDEMPTIRAADFVSANAEETRDGSDPQGGAAVAEPAEYAESSTVEPLAAYPSAAGRGSRDMTLATEVERCIAFLEGQVRSLAGGAHRRADPLLLALKTLLSRPAALAASAHALNQANAFTDRDAAALAEIAATLKQITDPPRKTT